MKSIVKDYFDKMSITFLENNILEITNEILLGKEKHYITFDDFVSAIISAKEEDNAVIPELFRTPILPKNTIEYLERKDGSYTISMFVPKSNVDFNYADETFSQVGYPNLIFVAKTFKNTISQSFVVAVKDNYITNDTKLYKYPLSNVFSSGGICWGGNKLPSFDELRWLERLPQIFLSSPINEHNYGGANSSNLQVRPILNELKDKAFPNDWLVPMKVSYGEWINKI